MLLLMTADDIQIFVDLIFDIPADSRMYKKQETVSLHTFSYTCSPAVTQDEDKLGTNHRNQRHVHQVHVFQNNHSLAVLAVLLMDWCRCRVSANERNC